MRPPAQADAARRLDQAAELFSQQLWCWGQDILRPAGNWLLEVGFDRVVPPPHHAGCPSIYSLALPRGRRVVLRGFGVFYADPARGGIFLPRYRFQPRYTSQHALSRPPWTKQDLPPLRGPKPNECAACAAILCDLAGWVADYESDLVDRLGLSYRRATLAQWDDGSRPVVPAEAVVPAWRALRRQLDPQYDERLWGLLARPDSAQTAPNHLAWLRRTAHTKPRPHKPTRLTDRDRRPAPSSWASARRAGYD